MVAGIQKEKSNHLDIHAQKIGYSNAVIQMMKKICVLEHQQVDFQRVLLHSHFVVLQF